MQLINWQADVFELKRMLSAIGIKVNAVMSAGAATVTQRRKTPRAAAQPMHLPVRQREKGCESKCIKIMQKQFDILDVDDIIPLVFENSSACPVKSHSFCNAMSRQS
jgi:nitrogenase molybdenum-iron protein alpha/beta subunit